MEEIQEKNTKNVSQKIPQAIKNALDNFKGKVFDIFMNTDFGNSGFGREKSQENQQLEIIEIDYDIDKEEYEKEFEKFEKKYNNEGKYNLRKSFDILYNLRIQGYDLFEHFFDVFIIINDEKSLYYFINMINVCKEIGLDLKIGIELFFKKNYNLHFDTNDIGFLNFIKKYLDKGLNLQAILNFVYKNRDIELLEKKLDPMSIECLKNNDIIDIITNELTVLEMDAYSKISKAKMFLGYTIYKPNEEFKEVCNFLYNEFIKNTGYNEDNWDIIMLIYSHISLNDYIDLPDGVIEHINELINKNKNDIYTKLKKLYIVSLEKGIFSEELEVVLKVVNKNGVGNLSQTYEFLNFLYFIRDKGIIKGFDEEYFDRNFKFYTNFKEKKVIKSEKLTENSKIASLLFSFEQRNQSLSNQEKTHFYSVSTDILKFSADILKDYLDLFNTLNQEQTKYFIENIYTLHNVLVNFSLGLDNNQINIDIFRKEIIQNLILKCKSGDIIEVLEQNKQEIQEKIIKSAKDKFGIQKMPETFNEEQIEDIKQFSIYYANISEKDEKKSKLIGIALGLKLNGLWEKFRAGEEINFEILFDTEIAIFAKTYKEKLKELFSSIFDINGLQAEISNVMIGSSETIDQKLLNIKTHIKEQLTDKDAYDDETYKVFELYKTHGGKLGKVLSLKFQSFTKKIEIDEESQKILSELGEINSAEQIKAIQEKVDLVKGVIGINEDLEKLNLDQDLNELNKLLIPSQKIIDIFIKLGEDFSSDSGAIALSQDVSYLVDLVQKDKQKSAGRILSEEEYKQAILYLNSIKEKLDSLYKYLFKIEEIFINKFCEKDKKSGVGEEKKLVIKKIYDKSEILKTRIESLKDEILKGQNKENGTIEMMTTLTSSLTDVIANIRGCLGCQKKEINNDTNLRFTTPNEFFIISRKSGNKKSFADQPVTLLESDKGLVFVIDTLRGETKTPDILVAHILVLLKKIKKLNTKNISILFPPNAAGGVGITAEYIKKRLKEEIDDSIEVNSDVNFQVKVPNQDYYDPHYEWGKIRKKEDTIVNGIEIKIM